MYISPAVSTYMFYPTIYSTLLLERPMPTLQIDPETLLCCGQSFVVVNQFVGLTQVILCWFGLLPIYVNMQKCILHFF